MTQSFCGAKERKVRFPKKGFAFLPNDCIKRFQSEFITAKEASETLSIFEPLLILGGLLPQLSLYLVPKKLTFELKDVKILLEKMPFFLFIIKTGIILLIPRRISFDSSVFVDI